MSLNVANGTTILSHKTHGFTPILEALAFAIHPGSSENTTTLCLIEGSLLVTSQNNLGFEGINITQIERKLAALRELVIARGTKEKKIGIWWDEQCVLSGQIGAQFTATGLPRAKQTILSSDKKINKIRKSIFTPMMNTIFDADPETMAELIKKLSREIQQIIVVMDEDIFRRAPDKTGFHGESRILRYIFIKWATSYIVTNSAAKGLRETLDKSRGDPEGAIRGRLITYMERKFVSRMRERGMIFGSSQGTCSGCCRALDICFAARGPAGNPFKQWLDPLDLSGSQGTTTFQAVVRQHALNLVLCDFDTSV
ncbi:hypothetical protein [Dyella sp.]|uniref:hypothetical protein n=1 Tax=Dyella sp. TaxID=1869338 RepID=UPI002D795610|nr:hypothetical protein [Dyella sp.]HET7331789.1 hypothetical protein [Dyella sp.]